MLLTDVRTTLVYMAGEHAIVSSTPVPISLRSSRGLVEPRLVRQTEQRVTKALEALRPGTDSLQASLRRSLDLGESVNDMAAELSKSVSMIRHHLARLGLAQHPGQRAQLDLDEVRDMYLVQRRTTWEIAEGVGWDKNTIRRLLLLLASNTGCRWP
jgi:hypothetical protein